MRLSHTLALCAVSCLAAAVARADLTHGLEILKKILARLEAPR
jgi:hypothetical protein